jgi:hypothetical protein
MSALQTIELTLRIVCEPDDAASFPLASAQSRAVCQAVAEALELQGRFYVSPRATVWLTADELDDA